MHRAMGFLRRINTWMAIAVLAMVGWLIDSLLWFLQEHPWTAVGFAEYMSHSWYVLPLLVAVLVIWRLRRQSELLALTIYDQRGIPIHHQGDFRLDEAVLGPMLASCRGVVQGSHLHRIDLPTGATAYFFRQGMGTLVVCFSGPPRPAQLQDQLRSLHGQELPTEDLLRDLPPDVAALATSLLNQPVQRDLLAYLWANSRMEITASDLAWQIQHEQILVARALDNLERLTLVRRQCVQGLTFYRLTDDEVWLARLARLAAWRVDWLAHARWVEQMIGAAPPVAPATAD